MNKSFCIFFILILISCNGKENDDLETINEIATVQLEESYEITFIENIVYAEGLSHESLNSINSNAIPLYMDAYIPNNNLEKRPLLMLIHGGGFTGGTKQQDPIVNIAEYFSKRGFVVFSIDYRLKNDKGTVPQEWIDFATNVNSYNLGQYYAMYPAHRDAKAALRWIIANAETYKIDTNYITVGGGSAGAITSIGIGVSELDDYTAEISESNDNTLISTNLSETYEIKTILDFWGTSSSIQALESIYGVQRFNENNPSLFIAHGTEDTTTLFSNAEELRDIYESNQVPYVFYELTGKGHGAWNATIDGKRLEKLAFDFIVEQQNIDVE